MESCFLYIESMYVPVEEEALAMIYSLESTRVYTLENPNMTVRQTSNIWSPSWGIKNPRVK